MTKGKVKLELKTASTSARGRQLATAERCFGLRFLLVITENP